MKKYKTQCEALVESGAIILVCDGFGENGTPIYVTRKVTGCYGVKCGRDSMWEVEVDKAFSDGATGVSYRMIKGVNVNEKISYEGLMNDMIRYDHITPERKLMIISDAKVRLRMAGEEIRLKMTDKPEPYNAKAKAIERFPREINRQNCRIGW